LFFNQTNNELNIGKVEEKISDMIKALDQGRAAQTLDSHKGKKFISEKTNPTKKASSIIPVDTISEK
jgi:hypothetical protein